MESSAHKPDRFSSIRRPVSSSQNSVLLFKGMGLMRGRVHEVTGLAADGFVASVLSHMSGSAVWVGRAKDVHSVCPLAVAHYFDPGRLVITECISRQEILWVGEQALRSKGVDCVVIQLAQGPNLRESRRLQLAAEEGYSLGLVIIEKCAQSSAAQTRWQCDPHISDGAAANDHGWIWRLTKNKSGQLGTWQVQWKRPGTISGKGGNYAAGYVHMVSPASL